MNCKDKVFLQFCKNKRYSFSGALLYHLERRAPEHLAEPSGTCCGRLHNIPAEGSGTCCGALRSKKPTNTHSRTQE